MLLKAGAQHQVLRRGQGGPGKARADDVEARGCWSAAYLLKGRAIAADPRSRTAPKDDEAREYAAAEEVAESLAEYAEPRGTRP